MLEALAGGAAWLTCPFVAPAHGARLWAELADGTRVPMGGQATAAAAVLRVRLPTAADVVVLCDGAPIAEAHADALDVDVTRAGAHRVEARIADRLWLLSNPVHLR